MDRKNDYDYDYDYDYDDVSNIISTNINHYLFSSTSTSPPTTPTATTTTTTTTTTDESTLSKSGLYRARLIMENRLYNELLNRYQLAISRLRQLSDEATALKEENEWLKLANEDLIRRFNRRFPVEPWVGPTAAASGWSTSSHTSVIDDDAGHNDANNDDDGHNDANNDDDGHNDANNDDDNDDDDHDDESFSLPKSISVRSPGFFKLVNSPVIANNQSQSPLQHVNGTRLKVRKEEKAIEMDVFNQGMYKTELCNKWEETRTCPYGQHCQFAHGLSELRPVIRHPRYKTQICRMVVAGVMCPYGHRCHFRHSLS